MSPTGLTKDAGWQVGASRTFPVDPGEAWDLLFSLAGLRLWLGETTAPLGEGREYTTADGTTGEVRSVRPRERVRITWHPPHRDGPAIVQVVVKPARSGTTITLHADHLAGAHEREQVRERWRTALDAIGAALAERDQG